MSDAISAPSECALEKALIEYHKEHGFCLIDECPYMFYLNQVNLGAYGIADIVKIVVYPDNLIDVTIVELKNNPIKLCDITQLARYMRGVDVLGSFGKYKINVKGQLLGLQAKEKDDFVFLLDYMPKIQIYEFSIDIVSGIEIKEIATGWYKGNINDNGITKKRLVRSIRRSLENG